MLKLFFFFNVFFKQRENPANIYFHISKIVTPKGAGDTDTVNKECNIQVYEEVSQMATEKYIYIYLYL